MPWANFMEVFLSLLRIPTSKSLYHVSSWHKTKQHKQRHINGLNHVKKNSLSLQSFPYRKFWVNEESEKEKMDRSTVGIEGGSCEMSAQVCRILPTDHLQTEDVGNKWKKFMLSTTICFQTLFNHRMKLNSRSHTLGKLGLPNSWIASDVGKQLSESTRLRDIL